MTWLLHVHDYIVKVAQKYLQNETCWLCMLKEEINNSVDTNDIFSYVKYFSNK